MHKTWKTVGHRGYAAHYPENTLPGFKAALALGVDAIEMDVQLTRDGVPIVIHDLELPRTCTGQGSVNMQNFIDLQAISCHFPQRFGSRFEAIPLMSLQQVCEAIQDANATVFIEIKQESIGTLAREAYLDAVLTASACLANKRAIISFDAEIVALAKKHTILTTGWCIEDYNEQSRRVAEQMQPQMLICSCDQPGDMGLWPGSWEWFVYGIETLEQAQLWHARGAGWIEADDPGAVLGSNLLLTRQSNISS